MLQKILGYFNALETNGVLIALFFCVFRYQSSDYEEKLPDKQLSRKKSSDYEGKIPKEQFPKQKGVKKQNFIKCKGHENEQNTRKSKSCLTSNATTSLKTEKPKSEPKRAKVDYEQKRKDKKNTDMASAFGFEEPEESELELVSKELNHFGVIAGLFRQIGGHSSRFVLFCSF